MSDDYEARKAMAMAICVVEGFNPDSTETTEEPYWTTWLPHAAAALAAYRAHQRAAGIAEVPRTKWDAVTHFARWAIGNSAWMGGDLDGACVQDKAEELGLIIQEVDGYNPEKHGPVSPDIEEGDTFYVFSAWMRSDWFYRAAAAEATDGA
ncbi:hypothetical protein [Alsobacter sp. R-9]